VFRKYILPAIAILGALFAIYTVYFSSKSPPVAPIVFAPPKSPYKHFVAGSGLIEAASENIDIGTPFNETITDVYVKAGDKVKKGKKLFKLNTQTIEARLEKATEEKNLAYNQYLEAKKQFFFYESLKDKRAVSESSFVDRFYAVKIAEDQVRQSEANMGIFQSQIERSIIRAPIDGEILKVSARVGQTAQINPFSGEQLVVFGDVTVFHIRVDVDEEDSWRIRKDKPAVAFVRGNSSIKIPLKFVKIEPLIVNKNALTADNQERVDTRVLQIIYSFKKDNFPVFIGQMLDVFIQSLPINAEFDEISN
jgi:HlyD family secretion protein